jgi:hypothetical protein
MRWTAWDEMAAAGSERLSCRDLPASVPAHSVLSCTRHRLNSTATTSERPMTTASMRFLKNALAASYLTALGVTAAATFGPAHAQDRSLVGTYINEAQSSKPIEAAIEAGILKMNFITRPVARSRLKKANSPHRKVEITRTQDEIGVSFDGNKPVRMPADGKTIKWTRDDGEVLDVAGNWTGDQLVQSFTAADGQRINTFTISPDGSTLTLQVELKSPRLPAPIGYVLSFTARTAP